MKLKLPFLLMAGLFFVLPLLAQQVTTIATQVGIDDALIMAPDGNLIGSNYEGDAIRKLSLDGQVNVFSNGFNTPNGLAYDSQGNLFMCDNVGDRIYKILPDGTPSVFITLNGASGLIKAYDSDTLIVTTYTGSAATDAVYKLAPDGTLVDYAQGDGLNGPVGLCYDENNNLYCANFNDRKIFLMNDEGVDSLLVQIPTSGNLGFIDYRNGLIYATLFQQAEIWTTDLEGNAENWMGSVTGSTDGGPDEATFNRPNGILFSSTKDTLFISDFGTKAVRMITDIDGISSSVKNAPEASIQMNVYPNPAKVATEAMIQLADASSITLILFDVKGQAVKQITHQAHYPAGIHHIPLQLEEINAGSYYLQLISEGDSPTVIAPIIVH